MLDMTAAIEPTTPNRIPPPTSIQFPVLLRRSIRSSSLTTCELAGAGDGTSQTNRLHAAPVTITAIQGRMR